MNTIICLKVLTYLVANLASVKSNSFMGKR